MYFGRFGLFVSFLLLAVPLRSKEAPQSQPPATVQVPVFLQQSLGALTKGMAINDVTLTGSARRVAGSTDETGTATLQALTTGETRVGWSFPSGVQTEILTNSVNGPAGQWIGPDGTSQIIPQHNLFIDPAWFFPALLIYRATSSQSSVLIDVGSEVRDGQPVEHLTMSQQFPGTTTSISALMQHLSETELYVDPSSLLPVAIAFKIHPDKNVLRDIPAEIRFSDYRIVSGAQVPFHVQRYVSGVLTLDLQFQTVALNTGLAPSVVTAP